jgi:hypothetical protein
MSSSERRTFCRDYAKSSLDGAGITCNVTDRSQVMDNADGSSWVETWVYVPKQEEAEVEPPEEQPDPFTIGGKMELLRRCGCIGGTPCEVARQMGGEDVHANADTPPEEEGDYAPKHFHLRQPELKRDIFGAVIIGTDKVEHLYCFDDCEYPHLPVYEPDCLFRG